MAVTPLAAGTDVSETISGKEHSRVTLKDTAGTDAMGLVAASPAVNTLLGRMKAIADLLTLTNQYVDGVEGLLSGTLTVSTTALPLPTGAATAAIQTSTKASIDAQGPADDIFAITPNDTVDLATTPRALLVLTDGNLQLKGTGAAVTIAVKAGMMLPLKAKRVYATGTTATVVGLA